MSFLTSRIALASRVSTRSALSVPARNFATSIRLRGEAPPILQGTGPKRGEIGSDEQQSTGLERFELMGKLHGVDVFDFGPLEADRIGTLEKPIVVPSMYPEQIIGCTGFPAESHETLWFTLKKDKKFTRCSRCGSVYTMDFRGVEGQDEH
ncbi:Cytochrome c oxidase subunit 4 [Malassezia vespertilionis]|uniref:Cox4p n=1 Tax=Malassezia vespertilionis TaxID=2020962 RepID=A0A2N1JFR1_9BASI|nr:Cytochrome c oxidase subunit 4 [Malassezia vespertilionis]PKI85378.1 Cox4p [Malassezia vespertilionis]WFD05146.1 Cytochrome c oxidase subunit 4 [Malassezia vespertilionis]